VVAGYSAAQVRAAEAPHLAAGEPLMRRAATALAATIRRMLAERGAPNGPVVLLVGSGDNGGDALFAGAELASEGVRVVAVPISERRHGDGERAARDAGVRFIESTSHSAAAADAMETAAIVVDGIVGTGTGASPALRGAAREIVAAGIPIVSRRGTPVVAVDLPSGIHPDDGSVPDPIVLPATATVTFGAVKAGLLLEPASRYAGHVELIDLGLGDELRGMTPVVTTDG
jgi:NAD(P)H-hydrate epimerase